MDEDFEKYIAGIKEEEIIRFDLPSLWKIVKAFLLLLSIVIISIANTMKETDSPVSIEDYIYLFLLFISILIVQRAVINILIPIDRFAKDQKYQIISNSHIYYLKSFYFGCTGFAYFLLIGFAGEYLFRNQFTFYRHNGIMLIMLFILLGAFAKARGIIEYLVYSYKSNQKS